MATQGPGFYCSTITQVVARTSVRLLRVVLTVGVTGGDITLYEGQDAASGRLIATLTGLALVSLPFDFAGIFCDRGLCVVVGANVTQYTVVFEPVPIPI